MLPISILHPPSPNLLVRELNDTFVQSLKKEEMCSLFFALSILKSVKILIIKSLKEAYRYESIGGNNSREALQQLLRERPYLKEEKNFSYRLCSIYSNMKTPLSLRLASKHNRATSFSHDITTWDKVK